MKNPAFIIFIAVAAIQLYLPFQTIWQQETTLREGTAYRFKTAPIDPADPFRGRYVRLHYEANTIEVPNGEQWSRGETAYVLLGQDEEGYVKAAGVSREIPSEDVDYVTATVENTDRDRIYIEYPFETFYMEESKAPIAEERYFEARRDTSVTTYALVMVKDGNAVLEDVLLDGVSLREVRARD